MIDTYQLHDALRFSGLAPDVPFHATDSSHEMKMRKFLQELGDTQLADERIAELEEEVEQAEAERDEAQRDLRDEERERSRLEQEVSRLNAELRARDDAAFAASEAAR
jgi:hypothetical protein